MILLKHMVQNIGIPCEDLEESTKDLPHQVKEVMKKPFQHFLDEIYFVRKKQAAFERGELGRAISLLEIAEVPLNSFPRQFHCDLSESTREGWTSSKAA
jgi:hypothetical protein